MLNPQACQALIRKAKHQEFSFASELPPAEAWRLMLCQDLLYAHQSPQIQAGALPGFIELQYEDKPWQEAPLEFKFPYAWRLQRWQHNAQYLGWVCQLTPQRRGTQIQLRVEYVLAPAAQRQLQLLLRQWEQDFRRQLDLIQATLKAASGNEWQILIDDPLSPPEAQALGKHLEQLLLLNDHIAMPQFQGLSRRNAHACFQFLESGVWQDFWQPRWFAFSGHARSLPLPELRHGIQQQAWPDTERVSLDHLHLLFVLAGREQSPVSYVPVPELRQQLWLWPRSQREAPVDKPMRWRVPGLDLAGVFQRQPGGDGSTELVLKGNAPRKIRMNLPGRIALRNPGGGLACFQLWQPQWRASHCASEAMTQARTLPYVMSHWAPNERLNSNACVLLLGFASDLAINSVQDWLFQRSAEKGFVLLERGASGAVLLFQSPIQALQCLQGLWQVLGSEQSKAQAVLEQGECQFFVYENKLRALGQPMRQANQLLEHCAPGHILLTAKILKDSKLQNWLHQKQWRLYEMAESELAATVFQLLPPRK